jgi:hypothetical protein
MLSYLLYDKDHFPLFVCQNKFVLVKVSFIAGVGNSRLRVDSK